MPLNPEDIVFTYSGGLNNANPDLSLGGTKSIQPITKKRLFNDIKSQQTIEGVTDYRCFYVTNNSSAFTIYDVEVLFSYNTISDVTVSVGFIKRNEIQIITVVNGLNVTSGTMDIVYQDQDSIEYTLNVVADTGAFYGDFGNWIINLQNAIRTVPYLQDVEVTGASDGDNIVFTIEYKGAAASRYHNLLSLAPGGNNLFSQPDLDVISDIALDRFTRVGHDFVNGTPVYFTALGTTTGVALNTTYFIVNSFTNVFQIQDSLGNIISLGGSNSTMYLNRLINKIAINFNKSIDGSPINAVADDIDFGTTAPTDVDFSATYLIGDFRPSDFIPIWIKRVVPPETSPVENDGFALKLRGDSV